MFLEGVWESRGSLFWYELCFHLWFWSWTIYWLLLRFSPRLCLGSGVKLQPHQLRSRALPNLCPVCHLTFYLSHFQFLSSEQTYTYPMIGHRYNQVMFVHSFLLLRPAFRKISTFYFWIVDKERKFVQVNFVFSADHCSLVELPVL